MDVALSSLLTFYAFSTGRRTFAMQQLHKVAKDMKLAALATHVAAAIKNDRKTYDLELAWASSQRAPAAPSADAGKAKRVDAQVDRALTALRDAAQAQRDGADPAAEKDLVSSIDAMLTSLFPKGVGDVTSLSFVDELNAVDRIVAKLRGEHAALVADLGLGRLTERLAKLAVEYRAALEAPSAGGPRFDEVRAARAAGQERMLEAVAMILGAYPHGTKEDVAARRALLAPILEQNEAIRQYLRSRRAVEDVNPDTGDLDPSAPPPEPAPPK